MKLLEEDPAETTRDILYTISQQLANSSIPAFPQVNYETPQYAVVVNGLFFTSLSCSIIAALLAVLALQWVANYDMGLNTSSARKRAIQRHIRWKGIETWKMGEIIASLPLLIFVSLFLFFIGIADWLWHLNRAISAIVIGGIGIGCLLYSITNMISIVKLEAPFRTPISKGLAPLLRQSFVWIRLFFVELPSEILKGDEEWAKIRWVRIREMWNSVYSRITAPPRNFAKCEDLAVGKEKDETAVESLIWLANSIEIIPASRDSLLALTKEIIQFPGELLLTNERINQAPWEPIFIELFAPYLQKPHHKRTNEDTENIQHLCQAFSMISSGVNSPIFSTFLNSIDRPKRAIKFAIQLSLYRHFDHQVELYRALDMVCTSTIEIDETFIHFFFLTLRHEWPKLTTFREDLLSELAKLGDMPKYGDPHPIPLKSLRVLLDIISHQDQDERGVKSTDPVEPIDPIDRYTSAVRRMKEGGRESLGNGVHRFIQRQLLFHIFKISFSLPSATEDFAVILDLLVKISSCKILALSNQDRFEFTQTLVGVYSNIDNSGRIQRAVREFLLNGLHRLYVQDDQPLNRWTSLAFAIDEYLETQINGSEYENTIGLMFNGRPELKVYTPEASLRDRLIHIKDPNIALWLMEYCPEDWEFEALVRPDFGKLNGFVSRGALIALNEPPRVNSVSRQVNFLCAMIVDGTRISCQTAITFLEYGHVLRADGGKVIGFIYLASKPL
jgi:hypothetical protein